MYLIFALIENKLMCQLEAGINLFWMIAFKSSNQLTIQITELRVGEGPLRCK